MRRLRQPDGEPVGGFTDLLIVREIDASLSSGLANSGIVEAWSTLDRGPQNIQTVSHDPSQLTSAQVFLEFFLGAAQTGADVLFFGFERLNRLREASHFGNELWICGSTFGVRYAHPFSTAGFRVAAVFAFLAACDPTFRPQFQGGARGHYAGGALLGVFVDGRIEGDDELDNVIEEAGIDVDNDGVVGLSQRTPADRDAPVPIFYSAGLKFPRSGKCPAH